MCAIYIHIPYCHHKCTYCDFHFSVNTSTLNSVLTAIIKEIEERKNYLQTKHLQSIYIGGGTPSLLSIHQLEKIMNQLARYFYWDALTEITIECNPEDINKAYLTEIKKLGFNRISLGIQSLNDRILEWMGRTHRAKDVIRCIQDIKAVGISNFSVDIILGIPFYDTKNLEQDIDTILSFYPPHISAYQLTIEPKTKLHHLIKTKKLIMDEDKSREEFVMIQEKLKKAGYIHYEISNYAQNGFVSQHNSAYWLQKSYLGIGPSAHSYNGNERRWNVANNYVYYKNVLGEKIYFEKEILNMHQKFNEYVYTRLRSIYGCNLDEIKKLFGTTYQQHFLNVYQKQKEYFEIDAHSNTYRLNQQDGYLLADKIAMEFFVVE